MRRVAGGNAPVEAMCAYRRINQKLMEDNATGFVREPTGAQIIYFPGRESVPDGIFHAVRQQGSIDGEVIRIGGKGAVHVPLALQYESQTFTSDELTDAEIDDIIAGAEETDQPNPDAGRP